MAKRKTNSKDDEIVGLSLDSLHEEIRGYQDRVAGVEMSLTSARSHRKRIARQKADVIKKLHNLENEEKAVAAKEKALLRTQTDASGALESVAAAYLHRLVPKIIESATRSIKPTHRPQDRAPKGPVSTDQPPKEPVSTDQPPKEPVSTDQPAPDLSHDGTPSAPGSPPDVAQSELVEIPNAHHLPNEPTLRRQLERGTGSVAVQQADTPTFAPETSVSLVISPRRLINSPPGHKNPTPCQVATKRTLSPVSTPVPEVQDGIPPMANESRDTVPSNVEEKHDESQQVVSGRQAVIVDLDGPVNTPENSQSGEKEPEVKDGSPIKTPVVPSNPSGKPKPDDSDDAASNDVEIVTDLTDTAQNDQTTPTDVDNTCEVEVRSPDDIYDMENDPSIVEASKLREDAHNNPRDIEKWMALVYSTFDKSRAHERVNAAAKVLCDALEFENADNRNSERLWKEYLAVWVPSSEEIYFDAVVSNAKKFVPGVPWFDYAKEIEKKVHSQGLARYFQEWRKRGNP